MADGGDGLLVADGACVHCAAEAIVQGGSKYAAGGIAGDGDVELIASGVGPNHDACGRGANGAHCLRGVLHGDDAYVVEVDAFVIIEKVAGKLKLYIYLLAEVVGQVHFLENPFRLMTIVNGNAFEWLLFCVPAAKGCKRARTIDGCINQCIIGIILYCPFCIEVQVCPCGMGEIYGCCGSEGDIEPIGVIEHAGRGTVYASGWGEIYSG